MSAVAAAAAPAAAAAATSLSPVKPKAAPKPAAAAAAAAAAAGPKADNGKGDKKDAGAIKGLDDDVPTGAPLKLSSKDKKEFVVERKHVFISTLVKTSLENGTRTRAAAATANANAGATADRCAIAARARCVWCADDKAEEVPIPGVTGAILELVVDYMKEHKGVEPPIIEKPLRSRNMKDVCPHKWDADYIDKIGETRQQLYDLILAANYMDIKSLLHLGVSKVASLIKGQPLEKIAAILNPDQKAEDAKKDAKDAKKDAKPADAAASGNAPDATGASAEKKRKTDAVPASAAAGAGGDAAEAVPASAGAGADAAEAVPVSDDESDAAPAPAAAAAASSSSKAAAAPKRKPAPPKGKKK